MDVIFIVLGLIVIGILFLFLKATKMNQNPRQQELARLIIKFTEDSKVENPEDAWKEISNYVESEFPHLSRGQKQTRVVHAISMIKPRISREDYILVCEHGQRY